MELLYLDISSTIIIHYQFVMIATNSSGSSRSSSAEMTGAAGANIPKPFMLWWAHGIVQILWFQIHSLYWHLATSDNHSDGATTSVRADYCLPSSVECQIVLCLVLLSDLQHYWILVSYFILLNFTLQMRNRYQLWGLNACQLTSGVGEPQLTPTLLG